MKLKMNYGETGAFVYIGKHVETEFETISKEKLKWYVLDIDKVKKRAFLLSENVLGKMAFVRKEL